MPPDSLFLALFLRRLAASIRDHLAAENHKAAWEMASHADILWGMLGGHRQSPPFRILSPPFLSDQHHRRRPARWTAAERGPRIATAGSFLAA
jgi:hypothetical protein